MGYRPKKRITDDEERNPYTEYEVLRQRASVEMKQRYEAEAERTILLNMRVHLGEHVCKITIEELPEGSLPSSV